MPKTIFFFAAILNVKHENKERLKDWNFNMLTLGQLDLNLTFNNEFKKTVFIDMTSDVLAGHLYMIQIIWDINNLPNRRVRSVGKKHGPGGFGCWTELVGDGSFELMRLMASVDPGVWRVVNNQKCLFTFPNSHKSKHTLLTRIKKRVEVACYFQQTR